MTRAAMVGSASAGRRNSAAKAAALPNRSYSSPRWRMPAHLFRRTTPTGRSTHGRSFCTAPGSNRTECLPAIRRRERTFAPRPQRARGKLRPRSSTHPRPPRRRRLGRQWTEAVVHRRRQGGADSARGPDRSQREEVRPHQRVDCRSSLAQRHHSTEPRALRQGLRAQFYDNVRVLAKNMVGTANNCWRSAPTRLARSV